MTDDAFHEIQLSGKQLVFLFMAVTAVSVVIFLCGVLVGRGVRVQQDALLTSMTDRTVSASPEPGSSAPGMVPAAEPPTPVEEPAAAETGDVRRDLSYPQRLETEEPAAEVLKTLPAPEPAPESPKLREQAAASVSSLPAARSGTDLTVQVAALRERDEAEAIVRRLSDKGYPAYLLDPAPNAPAPVYRVRVGKYGTRREAEQVVRRLEKEEQFKPWITR